MKNIQAQENVLELIGNTPLIKISRITSQMAGNFYAKVEAFNPGHSVKDRIALYIIEEADPYLAPASASTFLTSG